MGLKVNTCEHLSVFSVQIADLANEDTPQLYVACGRGPRSSLRVLRHGLEVRMQCLYIVQDWKASIDIAVSCFTLMHRASCGRILQIVPEK